MANELTARIQRLEDIQEIVNLQARYQFYFGMLDVDKIMDCFSKDITVSSELGDRGKYVGFDLIRKTFQDKLDASRARPGIMGNMMVVNPVIEVDEDGLTAAGLWYAFGPISVPFTTEDNLTPMWLFGKYNVKYIKEDGVWKFLHLRFFLIFRTTFDQGWVKQAEAIHKTGFSSSQPDTLATQHKPYNPSIFNEFLPGPPERK